MTLSVLTFAVTWAGCLTLAVAGAFSLGDRQRPIGEFDIGALYAALDERRSARGISWQQVTREINARFDGMPLRPVSASTLRTMREHAGRRGGRRASDAALVESDAGELRSPSPAATRAMQRCPMSDQGRYCGSTREVCMQRSTRSASTEG